MLNEKDREIINYLRRNSREKVTDLAGKVNLPVTTLYSKLKSYERGLVKRYTALVNFEGLGYGKGVFFVLKVRDKTRENKERARKFLEDCFWVNSLFRVGYNGDFLVECVFKDEKEVTEFLEKVDLFGLEMEMLNVVEEMKREEFMVKEGGFENGK